MTTSLSSRLQNAWTSADSMLCVGLDPIPAAFPTPLQPDASSIYDFCCAIVDATAASAAAFKPQFAHFAAEGREDDLARIIKHIRTTHPDKLIILDAKRGDIGSTADFYVREAFERYDADMVTINPYMGPESVRPFLNDPTRGAVVLCRTSNADSDWLQQFPADDPVFLRVADAAVAWNHNNNIMLVAGATYPAELGDIRRRVGDMPLLVPGVGAQGGDLQQVLEAGLNSASQGLLINASRSILYASSGEDFEQAAALAAEVLTHQIRRYRSKLLHNGQ
ncbi:MAG: orotidine-5'-phosphate decarboxylase [Proteobacteria bacterium]|nr:orotidine-5'-phosphate decarboxylase [Pseudomonadota bacterium]